MKKIGVFDSGIGGLSVAHAIEKALPQHKTIFVSDSQHVPYGTKTPQEILEYILPILKDLESQGCAVIVVACNTVSTNLIEKLRTIIKIPLISMEPMVKPAAELTKSKVIAVCATPLTLKSKRYKWLKTTYAEGIKVVEPDCSDWMLTIENNLVDREHIRQRIDAALKAGADVIVLGCTHFHWIEELVKELVAGKAIVLQPEAPVIEQLKRVLAQPI